MKRFRNTALYAGRANAIISIDRKASFRLFPDRPARNRAERRAAAALTRSTQN